jgi:hypothetical protein
MALLTYNPNIVYEIRASSDCTISFNMVGAGGGGGGRDTYIGYAGYPGLLTSGSIPIASGQSIFCAIGGPGYAGASSARGTGGGSGGYCVDGYSGGTGGNAGPYGVSGGGGGGGAASLIWKNGLFGYQLFDNIIAVSPGGPGGGGGGYGGGGYSGGAVSLVPIVGKYYPIAAQNGAYCAFLNTYGIWDNSVDEHYPYEVYFPTNGYYTFRLSADNFGYIYVDNSDFVGNTPGNYPSYSDFNQIHEFSHYVSAGWHTVDVYGRNFGGPASVAAAIISPYSSNYTWTTRDAYDARSNVRNGRGGKGQDRQSDGGGGGGGGGGLYGGAGGVITGGDVGAYSGDYGFTYVADYAQSYNRLLENNNPYGYGMGGGISNGIPDNGRAGAAIIESVQTDIKYKSSGQFIDVKEIFVKSGGWNKVKEVYVKDSGIWKRVYGDNIPDVYSLSVSFNNTSGIMTPYPPPPSSSYYSSGSDNGSGDVGTGPGSGDADGDGDGE